MNEAALSKKIAKAIRDRGGWARKIVGGPQSAGLPDILACYRGHFIGIETKMPGKEGTLTNLQEKTLDSMKAAKGIAPVITSVHEVRRILDRIDQLYE